MLHKDWVSPREFLSALAGLALAGFEVTHAEVLRPFVLIGALVIIVAAGLWLAEEFGVSTAGQETWRLFVPFYNCVVWWHYLCLIRDVERHSFAASDHSRGGKPLSVGRAFFWSSLWFGGGPYINRHLNALDAFARGRATTTPAQEVQPAALPA